MSGYIGAQPFTEAAYSSTTCVAAEGQSTFVVSYTYGLLDVYVNGVLVAPTDYIASDGSTVVFRKPLSDGDEVTIKVYSVFSLADTYTKSDIDTAFSKLKGTYCYLSDSTDLGLVKENRFGIEAFVPTEILDLTKSNDTFDLGLIT